MDDYTLRAKKSLVKKPNDKHNLYNHLNCRLWRVFNFIADNNNFIFCPMSLFGNVDLDREHYENLEKNVLQCGVL